MDFGVRNTQQVSNKTEEKLCADIDPALKYRELPAHMIVRRYIVGEEAVCDYEIYLRDYINSSTYFRKKSNGEKYKKPNKESNGENDAITKAYQIDFKLFMSYSMMEAKSVLSSSITKQGDGAYAFGASKQKRSINCVFLWAAIRYMNEGNFVELYKSGAKDEIQKDILKYIKNLRVRKNIIFFIPVIFIYSQERSRKNVIDVIKSALYHDLCESIRYREREDVARGYDTYLATIYDEEMLFFKISSLGIEHVDSVPLSCSEVYMKLSLCGWW